MRQRAFCFREKFSVLRILPALIPVLFLCLAFLPSSPSDQKERIQGTLHYQRTVNREQDLSNSNFAGKSRLHISDSATLSLQLDLNSRSNGIDYYGLDSLMAPYKLDHKEIQTLTPKDPPGPPTTITYSANCGGTLNKDGVRVYLGIDRKNKTYSLSCDIQSEPCDGAQVRDDIPVARWAAQITGGFGNSPSGYEGRTDGKTIIGSLTRPENGGSAVWSWNFSGGPVDTEAIIEAPEHYEDWSPEAGENERIRGNVMDVKVHVQKKGEPGKASPRKAKFKFELVDVSQEKGTCLNWPPGGEDSRDLGIEPGLNKQLAIIGEEGLAAESQANLEESSVRISCFDWGAYGKLKVTALLDDGAEIPAYLEKDRSKYELKIPQDENGNFIADFWETIRDPPSDAPDSDDEAEPEGDSHQGDGLTLYEEYRGFMEDGAHIWANPQKKDFFICNTIGEAAEPGIILFAELSKLWVHPKMTLQDLGERRVINRNFSSMPHIVDQHGVILVPGASASVSRARGGPGTPKDIQRVEIGLGALGANSSELFRTSVVAHELLHCCNVWHHGQTDVGYRRLWACRDALGNLSVCVHDEGAIRRGAPIRLIRESTNYVFRGDEPGFVTGFLLWIGCRQGQHSGDTDCVMRYVCAGAYLSPSGDYYLSDDVEQIGLKMCENPVGTGVNKSDRLPRPRFGDASRGNCQKQICVNDKSH
jgi:hypothetical protein